MSLTREQLRSALSDLISYVENNECQHEETHRGGAIWTICDGCGRKWADDRGGFQPYREPKELTTAIAALDSLVAEPEEQCGGSMDKPIAWMVTNDDGQDAYVTANPKLAQAGQRALPLYTRAFGMSAEPMKRHGPSVSLDDYVAAVAGAIRDAFVPSQGDDEARLHADDARAAMVGYIRAFGPRKDIQITPEAAATFGARAADAMQAERNKRRRG